MKTLFTYSLFFLGFLVLGNGLVSAQEKEELRKLKDLRQIEKGLIEMDEIDPVSLYEVPDIGVIMRSQYYGNSSMRLSKKINDLSISKRFSFNVEDDYSDIYFRVLGEVKEGSLKIKLFKPDNEILKEFKISPGKNQNWQQSFCLLEQEDQGFTGKWSLELTCDHATGYYQFITRSR